MCKEFEYELATQLLQEIGLSWFDVSRMFHHMRDVKARHLPGAPLSVSEESHIYQLGILAYQQSLQSETLANAFQRYEEHRSYSRQRTRMERTSNLKKMIHVLSLRGKINVSDVTTQDCREAIRKKFSTPATRNKARRVLHAFFNFAWRHKWCVENPVAAIMPEFVKEKQIEVLSIQQIKSLLSALREPQFSRCLAPVSMMLWAGIRPFEVARLTWKEVDLRERVIYIEPRHSKTGGARQVTIHRVLYQHLVYAYTLTGASPDTLLVPSDWSRLWRRLRNTAGLRPWKPDTLRHTFASYHLKYFHHLDELQWEMGHRDKEMLRTRYVNMRNLTKKDAAAFWKMPPPTSRLRKKQGQSSDLTHQQDL